MTCLACLEPGADPDGYHPACLERLFGVPRLPSLELELANVPELNAEQGASGDAISGTQLKVLMDLSRDRSRLEDARGGRYILKPQVNRFLNLPENEHLTMCLARLVGILVPEFCLLRLTDGSAAYIVKRFDRTDDEPPGKIPQVDFCALMERESEQKYQAHSEDCAVLIRQHSIVRDDDVRRFYVQVAFAYWTGNGDMHLKNLSLHDRTGQGYQLTPAYDLACSRIYIPKDKLALYVNGKSKDVGPHDWLAFGQACGLSVEEAAQILAAIHQREDEAVAVIERSVLPPDLQVLYLQCLRKRGRVLLRAAMGG